MQSLTLQPRELVEAGLYGTEDEVIQDALRHLLDDRPDLRIALAVHLYTHDEEWSLAGVAQFAGINVEQMRAILRERGVELRLGPATVEEARDEVAAARRWFRDRPH